MCGSSDCGQKQRHTSRRLVQSDHIVTRGGSFYLAADKEGAKTTLGELCKRRKTQRIKRMAWTAPRRAMGKLDDEAATRRVANSTLNRTSSK